VAASSYESGVGTPSLLSRTVTQPARRGVAWRKVAVPYLYMAPFLVLFLVFKVYPLMYGLYISLTDQTLGETTSRFIGLANYARLPKDPRFVQSMLNTFQFTLEATIPVLGLPLLLAVLLNRKLRFGTFLRSAFFFPQTLSVVTLGLVWVWMLDPLVGPINYYLKSLGFSPPVWFGDPSTAMLSIVITVIWGAAGYYMVIYLAGLQDIPRSLYEAAAIDGAGPWHSFWSITFPLLGRVFLLVGVVHVIGAFQIFGQVLVLTGGGPADATRTIVQHIYDTGFRGDFAFGSAAAMSWVLFVIIVAFSIAQFRLQRGGSDL
jgi:multiple sugar transport system permease protein